MIELSNTELGPCCACGRTGPTVRNLFCLAVKAPIAGRGWGCVQCGLPSDGAVVVLCDDCVSEEVEPRFACRGYPASDGRIPIADLTGEHVHNLDRHPELTRCRVCGCTEITPCLDAAGNSCWWIEPDLCSHCFNRENGVDTNAGLKSPEG